ncbi:hypothetical protein RHMOL_Rhmol09G0160400 [Rhododendron molle]|uniref:Uncharacterized protein n=1 Tax=Rhododendron molle TaxID=49168 RepID=A0ACC0MF21_RHOML|nr:hypothetical protein RHMOL_Rhmol09G0160400 [Rhododendron molle]
MYHVWRQRNNRIFRRESLSLHQLIAKIENDVRALISSWRSIKRSDLNLLICCKWAISHRVFGPRS